MVRTCWVACAVVLALLATRAGAEEAEQPAPTHAGTARSNTQCEPIPERFIGDWAYVPVLAVPGPLITSFAGSSTGYRDVDADILGPLQLQADLPYTGAFEELDLQLALFHRLALRGFFSGEAVVPGRSRSALNLAVTGIWSVGGGLDFLLAKNDRLAFSLFADYAFARTLSVQPLQAVVRSVEARAISTAGLFQKIDQHDVAAGPSIAIAISDWLGAVVEGSFENDNRNDRQAAQFIGVRGALSANFVSRRVPVGITGYWASRIPLGSSNPVNHDRSFGGGVFYTGRPWLDAGVELDWLQLERDAIGNVIIVKQNTFQIVPRLRAYF